MSVSDPLLKILKGHILKLRTECDSVTDYNPILHQFCDTLEQIFRKGLRRNHSLFGLTKKDYWSWIQEIPAYIRAEQLSPGLTYAVSSVKECKQVRTVLGRGRLFIRYGLARKSLYLCCRYLRMLPVLMEDYYDPYSSIVCNEILCEILLSLLGEVKQIVFKLRLENASFLDETWLIPVCKQYEFVPTKVLGIQVSYMHGRAIATRIQEESAASERQMEVGDVLDRLFDTYLNGTGENRIPSILKEAEGFPVYLSVIKSRYINNKVYPPIARRLRELNVSVEELESKFLLSQNSPVISTSNVATGVTDKDTRDQPVQANGDNLLVDKDGWSSFKVKFLGKAKIGNFGGVKMIECSIPRVLEQQKFHNCGTPQAVHLQLGESLCLVKDANTGEVLWKHAFTEISSCGRRVGEMLIFAYIAGETTCTLAKDFVCYVFEAKDLNEARDALKAIAQGFDRTHWLM